MKQASLNLIALVAIAYSLNGCTPVVMGANILAASTLSTAARKGHGTKCAQIVRENRARGISDDETYKLLVTEKCING